MLVVVAVVVSFDTDLPFTAAAGWPGGGLCCQPGQPGVPGLGYFY